MDVELERRALELFDRFVDLPLSERADWLQEACAGDEVLLARVLELQAKDDATGGLSTSDSPMHRWAPPQQIGAFRIHERIGQGGMGAVYRGQRVVGGFEQQVAIKVLQTPMLDDVKAAFVRRFEGEREILAGLNHPNIATLIDGGSFPDGTPYFVMELIDGEAITDYARGKPLVEILRVFQGVCAAVQSAHQRLVVHRDIKPSNVLVTADGQPKLLDFGIAKVLGEYGYRSQETLSYPALTPQYASPEQVTGAPLTTASDVYSLGALLFELVTGELPYDVANASPGELAQTVVNTPPRPFPDTIRASGSADLELIVGKALRKDPERRYTSASELAKDLENLAQHRPVSARADSLGYRISRFVRRNRAACALGLIAVSAVATGSGLAIASSIEANRESARLQTTTEFFQDLLMAPGGYRLGNIRMRSDAPMSEVVREAAERAPEAFSDDPETLVAMLSSLAITLFGLGAHDEAERVAGDALQRAQRLLPAATGVRLQAIFAYIVSLSVTAEPGEADRIAALVDDYVATAQALYGTESRPYAIGQILLAQTFVDPAKSLAELKDAHARYLRHGGLESDVAMGWRWQAEANARFGIDAQSAAEPARKALAIFTRPDGTVETIGGQMLQILGLIAVNEQDWPQARRHYEAALSVYEDLDIELGRLGPLMALGKISTQTENYSAARESFGQARELIDQSAGESVSGAAIQLTIMEIGLEQRLGRPLLAAERGLEQLELARDWESEPSLLMFLKGQTAAALYNVGRDDEADRLADDSRQEITSVFQGERREQILRELDSMLKGARQTYQDRTSG